MLRRTLLKALTGLGLLTAVKPDIAVAALKDDGLVIIPDWCPKGFLPMMGQKITPEQFPCMFEPMKLANGRYFYPIFWGKPYGIVEEMPFTTPRFYNGYELLKADENDLLITVIAVEPLRWPNGELAPPCFQSKIAVDKDKFEAVYGRKG